MDVDFGGGAGKHDDGDAGELGVALEFGEYFAAVLLGQVEVEQDQVGSGSVSELALLVNVVECFFAVASDGEGVGDAGFDEGFAGQVDVAGAVFDEQNVNGAGDADQGSLCGLGVATEAGSSMQNRLPPSGAASTQMRPRWSSMILRQIASPMPVPG